MLTLIENPLINDVMVFIIGIIVLGWSAELFVSGASLGARLINVSPLVVGATVVAFGSSAPELFSGLAAARTGQSDVVIGNIIGSNICNIGVALGLSALIRPFVIKGKLKDKEFVFFVISALIFYLFLKNDLSISKIECALLLSALVLFIFLCIRSARLAKHEENYIEQNIAHSELKHKSKKQLWVESTIKTIGGFIGLHYGSELFIEGAVGLGGAFNLDPAIIGLFLVAVGTSLPEIAISSIAALKKEESIALGNILGSNIFNILCVGGISSYFYHIGTSDQILMTIDLPIMLVLSVGFIILLRIRRQLNRLEGALFIFSYFIYLFYRI